MIASVRATSLVLEDLRIAELQHGISPFCNPAILQFCNFRGYDFPVWQPSRVGWWILLVVVLGIVFAWPPDNDRSLLMKTVNWAVDPSDRLPRLPAQLGFGLGDDPAEVEAHDAEVREYDRLYNAGGWTRRRLELKVAKDPLNPSTERQLLIAVGIVTAFLVWRFATRT